MDSLNTLVFAVLAIVAMVLAAGIYSLYRGGDFGRTYSNKLMRLRVVTQALAILVLVGVLVWRAHH